MIFSPAQPYSYKNDPVETAKEFTIRQISIRDPHWSPHQETNAIRAIYHHWEPLEASG